jgi:transposase
MVTLTMREELKLEVIQRVMDEQIDIVKACKILGLTDRSIYRLLSKVRVEGVKAVIHGNRGNNHAGKINKELREKIVILATDKYKGFNDRHFQEKLLENENIQVNRESLRQILREKGISAKQKRRGRKYRRHRERKEAVGVMLQIDASCHDWLESRGPVMTIVGAIDDASGEVWARFDNSESTWAYLRLMRQIAIDKGLPLSIYSDRHTIFHSPKEATIVDQLEGKQFRTQFGKSMDELGIKIIKAYSPQAKGRIERLWGTFQDRLIAEMRLAGIKNKDEANSFLPSFLKDFNKKFCCKPKKQIIAFRKSPPVKELDRILCLKEPRTVSKDHTIKFHGLLLQIPPSRKWASIAGQKVLVLQHSNGSVEIMYKKQSVARFSYESIKNIVEKCGFKEDHILLAA